LDESYQRAREEYGDDLVAITDHESFLGKRIAEAEWAAMMAACERYCEPERFITLPGYEWTGTRHPGPGHRCVYWPDINYPLIGREHPDGRSSASLVQRVKALGGVVFPHHVGWTGADAAVHDPLVQTCWEIVSCHGAYEASGEGALGQRDTPLAGQFARDQLEAGLRFGFVGGSDGHGLLWHHGVAHCRDSHRTGLTGLWLRELSRQGVFEALQARRTFATSGSRLALGLWVDGRPMGSAVPTGPWGGVRLWVEAQSPLAKVELIGSGGRRWLLSSQGCSLRQELRLGDLDWQDTGPAFLYLRVQLKDDGMGWSSPVWLDHG
jgi:hypothetical protein